MFEYNSISILGFDSFMMHDRFNPTNTLDNLSQNGTSSTDETIGWRPDLTLDTRRGQSDSSSKHNVLGQSLMKMKATMLQNCRKFTATISSTLPADVGNITNEGDTFESTKKRGKIPR